MDQDLIQIGELLTFDTPTYNGPLAASHLKDVVILHDAWISIRAGRISAYGQMQDYQPQQGIPQQDLSGKTLVPGFVDPHTHLTFAGSREHELVERIERSRNLSKGQRMAGGINYTVQQTRAASLDELVASGRQRLDRMLAHGTTTAEAKSGYGLRLADELKQLQAVAVLQREHAVDLVPTFLGAHALPPERTMAEYVAEVLAMIPVVAESGLAEFCDVFCEDGFFTVEDSRQILQLAQQHGLKLKVHADELAASGGALLAAELGAFSADHLQFATRESLQAMKAAGTIPTVLPGVSFYLGLPYANTALMRELDLPVAISTDLNPGGCRCESQLLMMNLAVTQMQMLPLEALAGITRNAAFAIDRGQQAGAIAPGRLADLVVLDAPSHNYLPYHFGINLVEQVYKNGQRVV